MYVTECIKLNSDFIDIQKKRIPLRVRMKMENNNIIIIEAVDMVGKDVWPHL